MLRLKFEQTLKSNRRVFERLLEPPPPSTGDAELLNKATTEVRGIHALHAEI